MIKILLSLFILFSFETYSNDVLHYTVFLKAGTILTSLKADHHEVRLEKGTYVKVSEIDQNKRSEFLVYNKKGVAEYTVKAENVTEIAEDTRLLPKENAQRIYPPKSVFKAENYHSDFETQFNLHLENLTLSNLNNIYNDQIKDVLTNRYELRTLYQAPLPIKFGLSLNYQSAYWKNDLEEVKLSILSLGPVIQYQLYQGDEAKITTILGVEFTPIYSGTTSTYTDKYSATLIDFGVESEWPTRFGLISLGSHFRHHQLSLSESNRENLQLMPKEFTLNSFGVMVGYKIEWEL